MNIKYKFQDWSSIYHRKSFIESEVYFSNNYSFNDPFDLQLPILTEGILEFDKDEFIEDFTSENDRKPTESELTNYKKEWNDLREDPQEFNEDLKKMSEEIESKFGILCLSNDCSNTLMWGHYANSHKGFCIGYNFDTLETYIRETLKNGINIFDVDYVEDIPKLDISKFKVENYVFDAAIKRFSTKHRDWSYEDETRIIVNEYANQVLQIPQETLTEVIFGYKMIDTDIKEITIICKELYPNLKLYKSKPNSNHFGMQKLEIKQ